ncbi:MAG TPA: phosphatase PAP2 family protein [Bacteroidia bacterium]|nr:phosphatase PAP2 family protein [Bacteroidia bacterium]
MKNSLIGILVFLFLLPTYVKAQGISETQYETVLETTGDVLQIALPLSGLGMTLLFKDKTGLKQHALAFASNVVLTHTLKVVVAKKRPETSSAYNAFPSGHTAAAFQGAAFIQRRYGWKYGKYAYVLAGMVGYSRIEGLNDRHDFVDVLGGAVLGISCSYLFTRLYEEPKVNLVFISEHNFKGLSVSGRF